MITLYGSGFSRWVRPYWTLKELDVPFVAKKIDLRAGEARSPEYLAINPFGKLPALVDGDFTLIESAAICTYLADKYPEKGLSPAVGTRERARYDQWVSFAISELEQPLWRIARNTFVYPEDKRSPVDIAKAKEDFHVTASTFESILPGDYLVGDRFSVADIMVGYVLNWARLVGMLGEHPGLARYLERLTARPAFPADLAPAAPLPR